MSQMFNLEEKIFKIDIIMFKTEIKTVIKYNSKSQNIRKVYRNKLNWTVPTPEFCRPAPQ